MNEKTPETYEELWAIILDSGAAVSACTESFCGNVCPHHGPHVPATTMTEEMKNQYITVTGEGLLRGDHPQWSFHAYTIPMRSSGIVDMAIPTSKKGATQHQLTQLKKFVMENGFGGSIIQGSADNSMEGFSSLRASTPGSN
eukprot:2858936-Amphidinium_carterae.1